MKGRRNRKARRGAVASGNIVKIPFRSYLTTAMTAGALQVALHPAALTSSDLQAPSSVFELFRFTKLAYELQPRPSAGTALVVGYYPDNTVTGPSGLPQAMENLDAIVIGASGVQTVPVKHKVPAIRLKGQISWYKATTDADVNPFENQGQIVFTGTGTEAVNTILTGVCEFKNPMDSGAAVRMMSRLRKKIRGEVLTELGCSLTSLSSEDDDTNIPCSAMPSSKLSGDPQKEVFQKLRPLAEKWGFMLAVGPPTAGTGPYTLQRVDVHQK